MNKAQARALGRAIRTLREDRRLAVPGCAAEVNLTPADWRAIERGEVTIAKRDIAAIAHVVEAEESDVYERVFDLL